MSFAIRQPHPSDTTNGCFAYYRNLMPLMDRFPRSAVVRAAVARYGSSLGFPQAHATPGDWAEYDRAASEGERLEPGNAYFPLMTALGLHERGHEPDALRALLRAGRCSRWDEHVRAETEGMWRLSEMGDPRPNGMNRTVIAAAILFPNFARLQGFAKQAVVHAAGLEATGHAYEGIAIRHALMQAGGLMRSQSTVLIGNLVGISIVREAAKNPGGMSPDIESVVTDKAAPAVAAGYERYLTSNGHSAEAEFVRGQFRSCDGVRAILTPDRTDWDFFATITRPIRSWVNSLFLLAAALLMLLCAAVVAVLALMGWADPEKRIAWPERILTTLAAAVVVLGPAIWAGQRLIQPGRWWQGMFNPKTDIGPVLPVVVLALLAVPIVLKVGIIIAALLRRNPLTASVVSGFQRAALPIAALMVLCYCGALTQLARIDREMADKITKQVEHEGRYYADLAGKQWPE